MIHSIQLSTAVLQRLPAMIPILVTLGGNFGKDISVVSLEALGWGYLPALRWAHSESGLFFFTSLSGSYL